MPSIRLETHAQAATQTKSLHLSATDKIKQLWDDSFKGAKGYRNKKRVARLINDTFGRGWINPKTDEDKLASKLIDNLLTSGVPEGYSNKYTAIQRVKKYAAADNYLIRQIEHD